MNANKSEYSFPRLLRLDQFSSDWGLWREVNMVDGECVCVCVCVWMEFSCMCESVGVWIQSGRSLSQLNGRTRLNMSVLTNWSQARLATVTVKYYLQQPDRHDKQWYQDTSFSACMSLLLLCLLPVIIFLCSQIKSQKIPLVLAGSSSPLRSF